ncbi:MAG: membrane protein insertion efficiency factor YidD [Legionellaceae bacterium]|nr:membrane protein insertion efficiency factor YidD [Legionellaceae bacterium]
MEYIIRTTRFLVTKAIKLYQYVLSPYLGPRCRFYPSCSDYALDSFHEHDLIKATWLTCCRLMRCHPWSSGGYDPVLPQTKSKINSKEKS